MTPFDLGVLLTAFLAVLTVGAWAETVISRKGPWAEYEGRERRR